MEVCSTSIQVKQKSVILSMQFHGHGHINVIYIFLRKKIMFICIGGMLSFFFC